MIQVALFARLAEICGMAEQSLPYESGMNVGRIWNRLVAKHSSLAPLQASTRAARNNRLVTFDEPIVDGDEIAFLPPVGGG